MCDKRRGSLFLMVFILVTSCTKQESSKTIGDSSKALDKITSTTIHESYEGLSLRELILKLQDKKIPRIIYYYHEDGNVSELGAINILDFDPEFFPSPNSGMERKSEIIEYSSDFLVFDIISIWTGAEEIYEGERKHLNKFKIKVTSLDVKKALLESAKELAIPAMHLSVIDVGPLKNHWDGSFLVRKPIKTLLVSLSGAEEISCDIAIDTKVYLLNYSDREEVRNGVSQYMIKIKYGDLEGWVTEEDIWFREQ